MPTNYITEESITSIKLSIAYSMLYNIYLYIYECIVNLLSPYIYLFMNRFIYLFLSCLYKVAYFSLLVIYKLTHMYHIFKY